MLSMNRKSVAQLTKEGCVAVGSLIVSWPFQTMLDGGDLRWTAAQFIKWKNGNCKEDGGCSLHSVIVKRLSWVIRQHSVIVKRPSWVKSESTQTSGFLFCTNSESESWGLHSQQHHGDCTSRRLTFGIKANACCM